MKLLRSSFRFFAVPSATSIAPLSFEEYLAAERIAETKSEFYDGQIFPRPSGNAPHSRISVHFAAELGTLKKTKGGVVFNSDLRVRIATDDGALYPDVSGLCGRPEYHDGSGDVLLNPSFIIEVLSKSTEAFDRGRKLAFYMALPSVVEIALVSVVDVRVDKYTRQPDGIWRFDGYSGLDSEVPFASLGCAVPLREVYAGVELEAPEPEPGSAKLG